MHFFPSMIIAEIDPTESFAGVPDERIIGALGIVPGFIDPFDPAPFKEQAPARYGFPCFKFEGTLLEDGTYTSSYEEDPDLMPLVKWERKIHGETEQMFMYEHAIVAFRKGDDTYITRMD